MLTYDQAIDEIFQQINEVWLADSAAIVGSTPTLYWPGVEEPNPVNLATYWGRVSQQTVIEQQATLRNGTCGQTYITEGLVFVQIFCPKSDARAMEKGRKLAILARDAYRGKSTLGKVWFRNARVKEVPPELKWYRFNVVTEYEYSERLT